MSAPQPRMSSLSLEIHAGLQSLARLDSHSMTPAGWPDRDVTRWMMSPPRAPFLTSSMLSSGNERFRPSSTASSSTSPCSCCEPCSIRRWADASCATASSSFFCSSAFSNCAFSCSWVRATETRSASLASTCFCTSRASASFSSLSFWRSSRKASCSSRNTFICAWLSASCTFIASSCGLNDCSVKARMSANALECVSPCSLSSRCMSSTWRRADLACSPASCSARFSADARSWSFSAARALALAASTDPSACLANPCSSENSCSHAGQVTRVSGASSRDSVLMR